MKREFRMKQQPLWLYIVGFALLGAMVYLVPTFERIGWAFFVIPVLMLISDLRTKYVVDDKTFHINRLFKGRRMPVSDIQKLWILKSGRLQLFHSRGFVMLEPKDREGFISAMKKANPGIVVEEK